MVTEEKPYRVSIILEEYDSDGFWQIFNHTEILENKNNIEDCLENIISNCKRYMKKRGLT